MPDGMDDMTPERIMEAAITLSYRSDDVTGPRDFTLAAIKALTDAGKVIVDRELTEAKRNEIGETISRMRHTATGGVVATAVHAIIIGQDTGS